MASRPCCPGPLQVEQKKRRNRERGGEGYRQAQGHPVTKPEQRQPPPGAAGAPLSRPQGARSSSPMRVCTRARTATYLNLPQDIQAFCDLPKYHVLAVQPIRLVTRQEELGAVGVGPGVGHGEQAWGREGACRLPPPWLPRPGSLRLRDAPAMRAPCGHSTDRAMLSRLVSIISYWYVLSLIQ